MEVSELRLYDRSRVVTDWTCARKRYLQYEYLNKGIVSDHQGLELFLGTQLHDGLAAIARGIDIDDIAHAATKQIYMTLVESQIGEVENTDFIHEQQSLVEGLLRGFHKHQWPRIQALYPTVLFIEEELTYVHNGLTFMAKPDLVVADTEGNAYYIEYKSTSSKKDDWVNSWNTAVQIHSTCKAIEATKGVKITATIVQGLYKGYVINSKQTSPFCYGYKRNANPPFVTGEVGYEYKAGLKKVPVFQMEEGVKGWVDGMPEDLLANQFPQTPPIFMKEDLVDTFFNQRDMREHEIRIASEMLQLPHVTDVGRKEVLDMAFPQRFDQCYPAWGGHKCEFVKICHGNVVDPLKEGFTWRTAHHALEAEQHGTTIE